MNKSVRLVPIVLLVIASGHPLPRVAALNRDSLAFDISCSKSAYCRGEEIIVESRLVNVGRKSLRVLAPRAAAHRITYTLRKQPSGRLVDPIVGLGSPLWSAETVVLDPGDQLIRSSELSRQFGKLLLEPGTYSVEARYQVAGSKNSNRETLTAESSFVVRLPTAAEQIMWSRFQNYQTEKELVQLLSEFPDSIFRQNIFGELLQVRYRSEDRQGVAKLCSEWRAEPISSEGIDMLRYEEASALKELGQRLDAVSALSDTLLPQTQELRRKLIFGESSDWVVGSFLKNYAELQAHMNLENVYIFASKVDDLAEYESITVEPVHISCRSEMTGKDFRIRPKLASWGSDFARSVDKPIVTEPSPTTLRLRAAIWASSLEKRADKKRCQSRATEWEILNFDDESILAVVDVRQIPTVTTKESYGEQALESWIARPSGYWTDILGPYMAVADKPD